MQLKGFYFTDLSAEEQEVIRKEMDATKKLVALIEKSLGSDMFREYLFSFDEPAKVHGDRTIMWFGYYLGAVKSGALKKNPAVHCLYDDELVEIADETIGKDSYEVANGELVMSLTDFDTLSWDVPWEMSSLYEWYIDLD